MARNYRKGPRAPGATPEERALLKTMIGLEVIAGASEEGDKNIKVNHTMYYKFLRGEEVPKFIREKIMGFVAKKGMKMNNMAKKSIDK